MRRGWFSDPALWAWAVVLMLALLPLRHALAQPVMPDVDDLQAMQAFGAIGAAPLPSVKRLGDNDLDCEQIYVEVTTLEKTNALAQAEVDAATKSITEAAQQMAQAGMAASTMATGMGVASSVAGMVPGAGMVAGLVSSASAAATAAQMQAQQTAMMGGQQRLMKVAREHAWGSARAEHLTDLFLKRGCRLSEVKAAIAAKQGAPAPAASSDEATPATPATPAGT